MTGRRLREVEMDKGRRRFLAASALAALENLADPRFLPGLA